MGFNNSGRRPKIDEPRINDEIRGYDMVRVLYQKKDENGNLTDANEVTSLAAAKSMAKRMELDLIEINPRAEKPIVRIASYDKYYYELKKQEKQRNKKPANTVKEIQLSAGIAENDMNVKVNRAKEFIADGDKVKVVLRLRGRENAPSLKEQAKKSLYVFIDSMSDVAVPEGMPREEGNRSIVIMKKKK